MNRSFIFINDGNKYLVKKDPIGWENLNKTLSRSMSEIGYYGVARKVSAELEFWGDEDVAYLQNRFKNSGTEGKERIEIWRKIDGKDSMELEYEGIVKFNPFNVKWNEDLIPSVSLKFEESNIHDKIFTRDTEKINIRSNETYEGIPIPAIQTRTIKLHQRTLLEQNTFVASENNKWGYIIAPPGEAENTISSEYGHIIPLEQVLGENENIVIPSDYSIDPALINDGVLIHNYAPQVVSMNISLNMSVNGLVKQFIGGSLSYIRFVFRIYQDDISTIVSSTTIKDITVLNPTGDNPFDETINYSTTLQLLSGQGFTIFFEYEYNAAVAYYVEYDNIDLSISSIQYFEESTATCTYRHEYLERLLQIITDQEDILKSDVFGRGEIGYESDGLFSNNVLVSGRQIRGFTSFPQPSLKDTIKSLASKYNVGFGIEKIDNIYKCVFEELPYFFKGNVIHTFYNCSKFSTKVSKDLTFSSCEVGYKTSELELTNGLEEYNNASRYGTYISSQKGNLDLVSTERADGYGIEKMRRKHRTIAGSEDTKEDNDIWSVTVTNETGILTAKKNEDYDTVTGIYDESTAYNLDVTPAEMIKRNGDWLNGCLEKYPTEKIKFLSSDKETDLVKTTGSNVVSEQVDIVNSDLKSALWINQIVSCEMVVSNEAFKKIEDNPYGIIRLTPYEQGKAKKFVYVWCFMLDGGGEDKKGRIDGLRCNLTSNRLNLIDSDGVDEDIPIEFPPEIQDFGFDASFELIFG